MNGKRFIFIVYVYYNFKYKIAKSLSQHIQVLFNIATDLQSPIGEKLIQKMKLKELHF